MESYAEKIIEMLVSKISDLESLKFKCESLEKENQVLRPNIRALKRENDGLVKRIKLLELMLDESEKAALKRDPELKSSTNHLDYNIPEAIGQ